MDNNLELINDKLKLINLEGFNIHICKICGSIIYSIHDVCKQCFNNIYMTEKSHASGILIYTKFFNFRKKIHEIYFILGKCSEIKPNYRRGYYE